MIVETIIDLQSRGFTSDFNLLGDHLFCAQTKSFFSCDQFDILEVHALDDEYSTNHAIVIYAIECFTGTLKGILFNNNNMMQPLISKIKKFWK
ncbi:MAG TPA: hypothetical protein VHB70_07585 [Parafilimonas sp.]|nr:hypothetical protein [Parafilimonas sp.]